VWVLQVPTEIHAIETRSMGQSVTVFTNFLASFSIAQAYLSLMCRLGVCSRTSIKNLHSHDFQSWLPTHAVCP
jgi:hypothetical protein